MASSFNLSSVFSANIQQLPNFQNMLSVFQSSPTFVAMASDLASTGGKISLSTDSATGSGNFSRGNSIVISPTSVPGDPTQFANFATLLAHELGHAAEGGNQNIFLSNSLDQAISTGLRNEGVALTYEYLVAKELGINMNSSYYSPSHSSLQDTLNSLALDYGINTPEFYSASVAAGAQFYRSQTPSTAPSLTYYEYEQDQYALNKAGIDTKQVMWGMVTQQNLSVITNPDGSWTISGSVTVNTSTECTVQSVNWSNSATNSGGYINGYDANGKILYSQSVVANSLGGNTTNYIKYGSDGATPISTTNTVINPDGSSVVTENQSNGTTFKTFTSKDNSSINITTLSDGSGGVIRKNSSGAIISNEIITHDANGTEVRQITDFNAGNVSQTTEITKYTNGDLYSVLRDASGSITQTVSTTTDYTGVKTVHELDYTANGSIVTSGADIITQQNGSVVINTGDVSGNNGAQISIDAAGYVLNVHAVSTDSQSGVKTIQNVTFDAVTHAVVSEDSQEINPNHTKTIMHRGVDGQSFVTTDAAGNVKTQKTINPDQSEYDVVKYDDGSVKSEVIINGLGRTTNNYVNGQLTSVQKVNVDNSQTNTEYADDGSYIITTINTDGSTSVEEHGTPPQTGYDDHVDTFSSGDATFSIGYLTNGNIGFKKATFTDGASLISEYDNSGSLVMLLETNMDGSGYVSVSGNGGYSGSFGAGGSTQYNAALKNAAISRGEESDVLGFDNQGDLVSRAVTYSDGRTDSYGYTSDYQISYVINSSSSTYHAEYFYANRLIASNITINADGSSDKYYGKADGSYLDTVTKIDGSSSITTNDIITSSLQTDNFNASGIKLSDSFANSYASGVDTFNADGSSSGRVNYLSGVYTTHATDVLGNYTTATYQPISTLVTNTFTGITHLSKYDLELSDQWTKSNGDYGSNIYVQGVVSSGVHVFSGGGNFTFNFDDHGNLTYQYQFQSSNHLEIPKTPASNMTINRSTLVFDDGVSLSDLSITATIGSDGSPSLLISTGNGRSLTIDGGLSGAVDSFRFSDGTTLSLDQLITEAATVPVTLATSTGNIIFETRGNSHVTAGSGNDTIYAWGSGDTLTAGSGVTTMISHSDNTTFEVNNVNDVVFAHGMGNTILSSVVTNDFYPLEIPHFYQIGINIEKQVVTTTNAQGDTTVQTVEYLPVGTPGVTSAYNGYGSLISKSVTLAGQNSTTTTFYSPGGYQTHHTISSVDSLGNSISNDYDAGNTKIGHAYSNLDGSHGTDLFNYDGTSSGTNYQVDGSRSSYTKDNQGTVNTIYFDAANVAGYQTYTKTNGDHGIENFNADGSKSGTDYFAGGNYRTFTENGLNSTATNFDVNGNELSYITITNDGAGNSTTTTTDSSGNLQSLLHNYADGSSDHTDHDANGGYVYYTDNGLNSTSIRFDSNGVEVDHSLTIRDGYGNSTKTFYDPNGNELQHTIASDDGLGNSTSTTFDANGTELSASYHHADGSFGNEDFYTDGGSFGVDYQADGSYTSYNLDATGNLNELIHHLDGTYSNVTDDGHGNVDTLNYDVNSVLLTETFTHSDGSYGDRVFNIDGTIVETEHYQDGSYAIGTTDHWGSKETLGYDANGIKLSDTINYYDGTSAVITDNGLGSITTTSYDAGGNESGSNIKTTDAQGNTTTTYFDNAGFEASQSYTNVDGTNGTKTFYPDGSSEAYSYVADGSYVYVSTNSNGNVITENYDANGVKLSDLLVYASGSYKTDIYNSDGSVNATLHRANGTYSEIYTDTEGIITTTNYDADNIELGYTIATPDGLGNITTTTYDASGNELSSTTATYQYNEDGSYTTIATDSIGNVVTTNFDVYGFELNSIYTNVDGTHGSQNFSSDGSSYAMNYYADGSYSYTSIDPQGDTSVSSYDSNNFKTQFVYINVDGGHGETSYNPNGSFTSESYQADGRYSTTVQTSPGNSTTTNFDVNGNQQNQYVYTNDGQGYSTATYFDANGTETGHDTTSSDSAGNLVRTSYDANGNVTEIIDFYANGSSSLTSYSSDGSYTTYVSDGQGNTTETNFDASGNELGYSTSTDDGQGNTTTIHFDASGNELGYSVATDDGQGYQTRTDYDASGVKLEFSYGHSGGNYGWELFNADGTYSGTDFHAEGGYTSYGLDAQGTVGQYIVNSDGSSSQVSTDSQGNITETHYDTSGNQVSHSYGTNDGQGNISLTAYDSNGNKISDSYTHADGSHGNEVFNSDGTINATNSLADGSYNVVDTDAQGNFTTTSYDANGNELGYSTSVINSPGNITASNYDASGNLLGSSTTIINGAESSTTTYDLNGVKVSDSYIHANGSHGSDIFNPDGTIFSSTHYQSNGTHTTSATNETGALVTINYDADNNILSSSQAIEDGNGNLITTNFDASGNEIGYTSATNNGLGSYTRTNFDVIGNELGYDDIYDDGQGNITITNFTLDGNSPGYSYIHSDGSHGFVTNEPGGYTSGTSYNPDGSYSSYTQPGPGLNVTTYFDATGNELSYTNYSYTSTSDGHADSESMDYTPDGTLTHIGSFIYDSLGNYIATDTYPLTGEVSGATKNIGDGFTHVYDNTLLGNGVTESRAHDYYDDGTAYSTDTVTQSDGSYEQSFVNRDGTSGSINVDANGTQIGSSTVALDGTQTISAGADQIYITNAANETLVGGTGNSFFIATGSSDVINTGSGSNIIAFDAGNGQEVINAGSGSNNTISLGGYFSYSDLAFEKNGEDLKLDIGSSDSITLAGWYTGNNNIVNLQVVAASMSDYAPGSSNDLSDNQVEDFDFQALVTAFDQAQASNPSASPWQLTDSLLSAHLSGSDTAALGGDLAFSYATRGNLTGFGVTTAEGVVSNTQFAATPQSINPWSTLSTGVAHIG